MKLFQKIVALAALMLCSAGVEIRSADFVDVPSRHEVLDVDSVFTVVAPNAKSVFKYRVFRSEESVTLYSDSLGRLLLAIHEATSADGKRVNTDTVLISPDGYQKRSARQSVYEGKPENYKVYVANGKDALWKHYCSEIVAKDGLVGTEPDANGNWTELHVIGFGTDRMLAKPTVTRQTSYTLTPEESEMLRHYEKMRSDIDVRFSGYAGIGFILLIVAAVIAVYTLKSRTLSDKLRPRLAGWASGPIALVGFYTVFENLNALTGNTGAGIVGIIFILLMAWYFRRIIVMLEDNENLSNQQVYNPFIFAKIGLLFIGWMVGGFLFHVWWAALLTAGVFAIPIFSVPDRGERCGRCNKVGAVKHADTENCGFRIESKREGNYMVSRKWQRVREVRRCKYCGYEYRMPEKDGRMEWEKFNEIAPAPSRASKEKPLSRADKALQSIDYKDPDLRRRASMSPYDCLHYGSGGECRLGGIGEPRQCEHADQSYCPYFSPSGSFCERARQIVRNDNTPI